MASINRRSFVRTAFAGATALAIGVGLHEKARAADAFKDVKFAKDPAFPQPGLEAAHVPSVAVEPVDAKSVAFGKTPAGSFYRVTIQARHEATAPHHILGISLYKNGELVAGHTINPAQPETSLPFVTFVERLQAGDELVAVTSCNLHGQWGNRISV